MPVTLLSVLFVPFAKAFLNFPKMVKQNILVEKDVKLFPLSAAKESSDDTTASILWQYESKHPGSAEAAASYVTSLRSSRSKMIVFDKDGTLGDCTASLRRWVLHVTDKVLKLLSNPDELAKVGIVRGFHKKVGWDADRNNVVPSAPVAAGTWEDIVTLVHEFLLDHSSQCEEPVTMELARKLSFEDLGDLHGEDPPVVDNLKDVLSACQRLGYLVAICTSDDRAGTDLAMKSWGIDNVVDVSVCGDEVSSGKPSAVPLQVLCQRANQHLQLYDKGASSSRALRPQDVIMVGDTTADTGMARAAQAGFCVGVLTGSGTTEQLLETGAHLILPHVGHIPALLESLEKLALEREELQ